jgi:mRNA interferase RelE/StbE
MSKKRNGPEPRPAPRRHEIQLTRAARHGLSTLPKAVLRRVDAAILALADDPHPPGSKKLQGEEDLYRIRVGDFRVLYRVEEERLVLLVVNVGNRRDIYRSL